jgi:hypothetical protein
VLHARSPFISMNHSLLSLFQKLSAACSFLCIQIACFSVSFIFSTYWLLLWARFQLRLLRSTSPPDRKSLPSEHARKRPPAKVWRHFGTFTALACAGKPGVPSWRSTVASRNSRAQLFLTSQGLYPASLLGLLTFNREIRQIFFVIFVVLFTDASVFQLPSLL